MSISTEHCKWCKGTGVYVGLTETSPCTECAGTPNVSAPQAILAAAGQKNKEFWAKAAQQVIVNLSAADTDADWVSILAKVTARMSDEINAGWMYKADQWHPEPRAITGFSDLDKPVPRWSTCNGDLGR